MLTLVVEYTRECLAIDVARRLISDDVLVRLARVGGKTLFIEPGSPWEDGYVKSFNGKLSDELLNREIFYTPNEAKILIERWRVHYNTVRPHTALGYRPPVPEARMIVSPCARCTPPAHGVYYERCWTNITGGLKTGCRSAMPHGFLLSQVRPASNRDADATPNR
jgi:hypothetical protein